MEKIVVTLFVLLCLTATSCVGVSVESRLTADDENAVDTVLCGVRELKVKSLFDVSVSPSSDSMTYIKVYVDKMEVKNYFSMDTSAFSVDCRVGVVEVAPDLPFFSSVVKAQGAIRIEIPASVISVTVDTPSGNIDVRGINVRKLSLRTDGGSVSVKECSAQRQVIRQSDDKMVKKEKITINRD